MSGSRILNTEAMRIELKTLKRMGFIQKGAIVSGELSWTNGNKINVQVDYKYPDRILMNLNYNVTLPGGEKKDYSYSIWIDEIPSNLGKGNVLYFTCPRTYKHCRILYLAYGSGMFLCREAYTGYRRRIYYGPQLDPSRWRANTMYFKVDKQIEELDKRRATYTYKGKETKRALRLERLIEKREYLDRKRFSLETFPKSFLKHMDLLGDLMYTMGEKKHHVKHSKKASNS